MKRATGKSNATSVTDKVSIQLALNGHAFSTEELLAALDRSEEPVEVSLFTPRTMLVPEELFDAGLAVALLDAAGLPPAEGEEAVWSMPQEGIVALMAFNRSRLEAIRSAGGDRIRFTTPLVGLPAREYPCIRVHRAEGLLYIKVYEDRMRMAEVVAPANEAETVYLFERLKQVFPPQDFVAVLSGEAPKELRRLLGKGFQRIVCE